MSKNIYICPDGSVKLNDKEIIKAFKSRNGGKRGGTNNSNQSCVIMPYSSQKCHQIRDLLEISNVPFAKDLFRFRLLFEATKENLKQFTSFDRFILSSLEDIQSELSSNDQMIVIYFKDEERAHHFIRITKIAITYQYLNYKTKRFIRNPSSVAKKFASKLQNEEIYKLEVYQMPVIGVHVEMAIKKKWSFRNYERKKFLKKIIQDMPEFYKHIQEISININRLVQFFDKKRKEKAQQELYEEYLEYRKDVINLFTLTTPVDTNQIIGTINVDLDFTKQVYMIVKDTTAEKIADSMFPKLYLNKASEVRQMNEIMANIEYLFDDLINHVLAESREELEAAIEDTYEMEEISIKDFCDTYEKDLLETTFAYLDGCIDNLEKHLEDWAERFHDD